MADSGFRRHLTGRGLRLGLAAFALLICAISISMLAIDVAKKIKAQETAGSDNVQWTLSQVDVEFLSLELAIADARAGSGSLSEVHRRFDVFYSRIATFRTSPIFDIFRGDSDFRRNVDSAWAFLQRTAPKIDGANSDLQAQLAEVDRQVHALRPVVRAISLVGIRAFAEKSDADRKDMERTLTFVALLTLVMVVTLVALVIALVLLDRANRARVAENLDTLSRLESIVTTALDAVITADADGRIVDFNAAASGVFGYSRQEAVGAHLDELIIPVKLRAAHRAGMARLQKTGEAGLIGKGRVRLEALHKSGRIFPVELSLSQVVSAKGTLYVAFLRDLTEQVAAEAALTKARDDALAGEKAKANLLAVMSHEMRTPLNGLIGAMELLEDTPLQPRQREYLRIMDASGKLLMHHVNDVLDIARLDSGISTPTLAFVDLVALVRELLDSQKPASIANGNTLIASLPADGRTRIISDGVKLRQILLNLIGNAAKFTHNGTIRVEIEHLGAEGPTEFRVIDTGIGIAAEDIDRIFEDFVTLDASYARLSGGTGLGLGIVRRIVDNLGGTLGVESRQGQGSTFRFSIKAEILPAVPARAQDDATSTGPGARRAGPGRQPVQEMPLTVLVVEDNAINRQVVREMLARDGHLVVEAEDGEEGVRMASAQRFDLILMDISMPRMDGLAATSAIRQSGGPSKNTPIVALTAHALPGETAGFRAEGMQDLLIKPISVAGLREVIRRQVKAAPARQPRRPSPDNRGGAVLIDREVLDTFRQDMGDEQAAHLVARFIQSTDAAIAGLQSTDLAALPSAGFIRKVHKLTGSAALFGARALHHQLVRIETLAKTGQSEVAVALVPELITLWQATRTAFETA